MFLTVSTLVQPALSYGCEVWGLEGPSICSPMTSIHNLLTERALHVRKSFLDDVCLCELGRSQFCKLQLLYQSVADINNRVRYGTLATKLWQ